MNPIQKTTFKAARRVSCAVFLAAAAVIVLGGLAQPAQAADFPTKPIKIVLPFPAGGGADATARLVAQKLSEALKQPVIIDNRPGANGLIGTDAVAKAAPDGYTVLFTDRGALGINPSLYKNLPYDPLKDFEYVGIAAWGPYVLVAHSSVPVKTFAELVEYAKKNPGKLNYSSFGVGSMPQMGMESLNSRYGMNIRHVPYKGGAPAAAAVLSGEVDVTLSTLGNITGSLKDGRLKALVIGAGERSPLVPQVPSMVEVGGTEDTIPGTYFGFALPARTPKAIVTQLSTEIRRIVAMPDVIERFVSGGFQPGKATPEDMAEVVRRDVSQFGKLSAAIGIKPE